MSLENVLHIAPNAFANGYNIYRPDTGDYAGAFALPNFSNPIHFVCGAIGALENATAPETAKLCAQYLGPGLRLLNANVLTPFEVNPYLMPSADPADRGRHGSGPGAERWRYRPPTGAAACGVGVRRIRRHPAAPRLGSATGTVDWSARPRRPAGTGVAAVAAQRTADRPADG